MNCPLKGLVGGVDEAGRGPLAGPVVSSCVVWKALPEDKHGVADSKLLTEQMREHLFSWISGHAHRVGIGIATHEEIEELNILNASLLSMERAVRQTGITPDIILIDGNQRVKQYPHSRPVVKGDRKCFYIACASIIAKVVRDRIMVMYDSLYPAYNFRQNKGYPTRDHKELIGSHGVSPIHRKTFSGVREHIAK
jgi:ribonuclease HII